MDQSFVGTIYMFGGNFNPRGFAYCNGSLMSIAENQVLYTLLGTTYGGDGQTTFGLPDLRGKFAIGAGQGPGLSNYVMGQVAGTERVTLTTSNLASHNHMMLTNTDAATLQTPSSSSFFAPTMQGSTPVKIYSDGVANVQLNAQTIVTSGSSIPTDIVQPLLAITYVITLYGIFPTHN